MITTLALAATLNCPFIWIKNISKEKWSDNDATVLNTLQTRCPEINEKEPCPEYMIKKDDDAYEVGCTKELSK